MKTRVIEFYDYTKEKMQLRASNPWHIHDDEILEKLNEMARNESKWIEEDVVKSGDAIQAESHSENDALTRKDLLIFPGHGLCTELEQAVLGARVKETRSTKVKDASVTVTVTKILRRCVSSVDNAFIASMKILNVTTIKEYCDWYRLQEEPIRRKQSIYRCAWELLHLIAMNSKWELDEEELQRWQEGYYRSVYGALIECGMEDSIDPAEKKRAYEIGREQYLCYQMSCYLIETVEKATLEEVYHKERIRDLEAHDVSADEIQRIMEEEARVGISEIAWRNAIQSGGVYALWSVAEHIVEE